MSSQIDIMFAGQSLQPELIPISAYSVCTRAAKLVICVEEFKLQARSNLTSKEFRSNAAVLTFFSEAFLTQSLFEYVCTNVYVERLWA